MLAATSEGSRRDEIGARGRLGPGGAGVGCWRCVGGGKGDGLDGRGKEAGSLRARENFPKSAHFSAGELFFH
eukprot:747154-Hanusia_phi.AAC.3